MYFCYLRLLSFRRVFFIWLFVCVFLVLYLVWVEELVVFYIVVFGEFFFLVFFKILVKLGSYFVIGILDMISVGLVILV